jgi:leucine-rich repeat protein SHOC2
MKKHFEFNDDKSSKYWEISIEKSAVIVRYGKIGSQGQMSKKSFDNKALAEKEVLKLIAEKTKKGYIELVGDPLTIVLKVAKKSGDEPKTKDTTNERFISESEANTLFNIKQFDPIGDLGYDEVLLLEGDTVIEGNLDENWLAKILKKHKKNDGLILVLVNGNIKVSGNIDPDECFYFLVLGNVECLNMFSHETGIDITGNAKIHNMLCGVYNHGFCYIAGTTHAAYIVLSDHDMEITPEGGIRLNCYDDEADFEFDFYESDLERVMISKTFVDGEFDVYKMMKLVKKGVNPFKPGIKTSKQIFEEELKKIVDEHPNTTELDLSEKRFTSFPAIILQLKKLKILNLSSNSIQKLPEEICELIELEELNLHNTNLKELPKTIGKLKKLKSLNISCNVTYDEDPKNRNTNGIRCA